MRINEKIIIKLTGEVDGSIEHKFEFKNDGYNLMDQTSRLNVNFPYMLNVPSMENRLHFIKEYETEDSGKGEDQLDAGHRRPAGRRLSPEHPILGDLERGGC